MRIFYTAVVLLFASTAFASNEYKIDFDTAAVHHSVEEQKPAASWSFFEGAAVEGGVSSWTPHNYLLPSQVPGASAFSSTSVPHFEVSLITAPIWSGSLGALRIRGGVGLSTLQRSGTLSGSSVVSNQDLVLLPLSAGFQYGPSFLAWQSFSGYIAESAMPTLAFTQRSIFDEGTSNFGIASQTLVGVLTDLGGLFRPFPATLDVNFSVTSGSVGGGSLYGLGVGAGLRVGI